MELLDPPTDPGIESRGGAHRLSAPRRRFEVPAWLWAVLAVAVCALVVTLVYGFSRDATPTRTPAGAPVVVPTTTISVAPAAPSADLPEGAFAGDSISDEPLTYEVGRHIAPGTYTTAGAIDPDAAGRWDRRGWRSSTQRTESLLDGTSVGPATVTLKRGDVFETEGYKPWMPAPTR